MGYLSHIKLNLMEQRRHSSKTLKRKEGEPAFESVPDHSSDSWAAQMTQRVAGQIIYF